MATRINFTTKRTEINAGSLKRLGLLDMRARIKWGNKDKEKRPFIGKAKYIPKLLYAYINNKKKTQRFNQELGQERIPYIINRQSKIVSTWEWI